MKTLKESISRVKAKYPRIPEKVVDTIIKEYHKSQLETLVEYGHLYVTPEIKIDIVPITPRRYVLRGKEYKSIRLYKLKSTITDDNFYKSISEEYDRFREDI